MDINKLTLKPANDQFNRLRKFKEPKTDIYDENLAKLSLEQFKNEDKRANDKSAGGMKNV